MLNILDFTPEELRREFEKKSIEAYRADQILKWVFEKGVYEFDKMTDLSLDFRKKIKESFFVGIPKIADKHKSAGDNSVKLLIELPEKKDYVEAVYMPMKTRQTVCISSQVGCKFHCAFCASGQNGFFRNLKMSEMLAQVLMTRDLSANKKITNIVFMGIGEPFDNYTEMLRTVKTLNSKNALGLGARKMTISTCGIVPKINDLSEKGMQVELSVSLHGPNDAVRGAIMPVNKAYPIKELIAACKNYIRKTKRAITFEYILIRGVNSSEKEARQLAKLLKGMICKVNLIPYNPIEEFPHGEPTYQETVRFQQILQESGIRTTVRFSKGREIGAACGQLRSVKLKNVRIK